MKVKSESEVAQSCPTLATPWTAAYQAPLSMGFSRQKYWSGVPLPSPCMHAKSLQLCPTLCDPLDCSPSGSSVHGILWAWILEWVTMPFSKGSSQPRDQTQVSHIAGRFFTVWATKHEWKKSILDHEINNMDISIFPHSLALFSGHVKMCVHVSNLHRHKFYIYRPCIILCLRSLGK